MGHLGQKSDTNVGFAWHLTPRCDPHISFFTYVAPSHGNEAKQFVPSYEHAGKQLLILENTITEDQRQLQLVGGVLRRVKASLDGIYTGYPYVAQTTEIQQKGMEDTSYWLILLTPPAPHRVGPSDCRSPDRRVGRGTFPHGSLTELTSAVTI